MPRIKNTTVIIVFLIVLVLFIAFVDSKFNRMDVYDFKAPSYKHGDFTLCLIGSVHGNEPAGTVALKELLSSGILKQLNYGRVIVIPNPNPAGLHLGKREAWHPDMGWIDLNRQFTQKDLSHPNSPGMKILKYVHQSHLVVEFHEGWGFHKIQPKSLGSTIMPSNNSTAISVGVAINKNMNTTIDDPNKEFTLILDDSCGITSTLACYCEKTGIGHILIEITGQNDVQPLSLRKDQALLVVAVALYETLFKQSKKANEKLLPLPDSKYLQSDRGMHPLIKCYNQCESHPNTKICQENCAFLLKVK